MERRNFIKTAKAGYIVISLLLVLMGIVLAVDPDVSAAVIGRISGTVLLAFGVFKLIGYYSKDLYRLAFQHDLALGIFIMIIGTVVIIKPADVLNFICITLGLFTLVDALLKVQTAVDSRRFGLQKWWLIMSAAVVSGIVGILLVFRPSESVGVLMTLLGIAMMLEGVLNLVTVLTAVKLGERKTIETEFAE